MTDRPIRQALLSVSDKTGIVEFAPTILQYRLWKVVLHHAVLSLEQILRYR